MKVKLAFFTAASRAGKTTLQEQMRQQGLAILDNDIEIMKVCFDEIAPGKGYHQSIQPMSSWKHLRSESAFDICYMERHKKWLQEKKCPVRIVAVGWLYAKDEWRRLATIAFSSVPNVELECRLFILNLSHDQFFCRYNSSQWERFSGAYGWKEKTIGERRSVSDRHYDEFINDHLELPADMPYLECTSDDELLRSVQSFMRA